MPLTLQFLQAPWEREINYKMIITDFNKNSSLPSSPLFPEKSQPPDQWTLSISNSYNGYYSLKLEGYKCRNGITKTLIILKINNKNTDIDVNKYFNFGHEPENVFKWRDCIKQESLWYTTSEISCNIKFLIDSREEASNKAIQASKDSFLSTLGALLDDPNHGNVVLVSSEGMEQRAHKMILGAHSSVFRAMFSHEMEENVKGKVVISDVDHKTLRALLVYIYTGTVPPSLTETEKIKLLSPAEKYDLPLLKSVLEELLVLDLCKENAVRLLILSDRYSLKNLFQHLFIYFTSDTLDYFSETEEWKNESPDRLTFLTAFLKRESVLQKKYDQIDTVTCK